jgi:hypothetical protein
MDRTEPKSELQRSYSIFLDYLSIFQLQLVFWHTFFITSSRFFVVANISSHIKFVTCSRQECRSERAELFSLFWLFKKNREINRPILIYKI